MTNRCSDAGCLHAMMMMVNVGLLHAFRLAGDRRETHSGGSNGGDGAGDGADADADADERGDTRGRGGGGVGRDLDTDNTAPRLWRWWCCSLPPAKKTEPYWANIKKTSVIAAAALGKQARRPQLGAVDRAWRGAIKC